MRLQSYKKQVKCKRKKKKNLLIHYFSGAKIVNISVILSNINLKIQITRLVKKPKSSIVVTVSVQCVPIPTKIFTRSMFSF